MSLPELTQKKLLVAEVKSMIVLLNDRLGDDNPWLSIDIDTMELAELNQAKRLIHELLYSPPSRSR